MLWEAAAVAESMRELGKQAALARPENAKYLQGWGRYGDDAVVAVDDTGARRGAAWYRLFPASAPGYGFVSPDVPELSLGVAPDARGLGVGQALLAALIEMAKLAGYPALSLSVDRHNTAVRLYIRSGFVDAFVSSDDDSSITMITHF